MGTAIYEFVRGPLTWIAFITLVGGSAYRLRSRLISARRAEAGRLVSDGHVGLQSIFQRVSPFSRGDVAQHPAMALTSFVFHVLLLFIPFFVMGHAVLWHESWGISWWSLPEGIATAMTLAVLVGGLFFALQWSTVPEVRASTAWSDWLLLVVALAPFLTGFLAKQQVLPYKTMLILHIVSGVLWLMLIPFTRLFQMLWFGFSKAYMRVEFGATREARD